MARVIRLIRLIRIVKLYKTANNALSKEQNEIMDELNDDLIASAQKEEKPLQSIQSHEQ